MKKIPLKGKDIGKFFIIDDSKFKELNKYNWFLSPNGYARAHIPGSGNANIVRSKTTAHTLIAKPKKGMQVDHINGNKLDNRKQNLRVCNRFENRQNRTKRKGLTSIYIGVNWIKTGKRLKRWRATIKSKLIGDFKQERHAAMAYDIAAKELYGNFAKLNF